jgi:hypothetical protein
VVLWCMTTAWHQAHPELAEEIRGVLRTHYPTLHLVIDGEGRAEVCGTFPVRSPDGVERDRYQITIELLADFPKSLPIVREVGGRIPWKSDRHVNVGGTCCVLIPDARWRSFPEGAPFRQFLDGPLYDFFLSQSLVALGEPWPFGQWSHEGEGLWEYYRELLQTTDKRRVARVVYLLSRAQMNPRCDCPCGKEKKLRDCCLATVADLRKKIPWEVARTSAKMMGIPENLYNGRRLR